MTLTEAVLLYAKDSEAPRKYYYWSTLAAIAGVIKDRVVLDKFYYKLAPNIFVLLVGRSGLRKGAPVALAKTLVAAADTTKLFSGRVSIQGVISGLSKVETKKSGGPPQMDAAGYLSASEFASFIIEDKSALTILTDLYDGHYNPEWSYMLRNSPTEKLKAPCLTLLGASNEVHLKDALPDNAIGGGFVARTFIVYASKKHGINSLTDRPENSLPYEYLVSRIQEIARAKGEFKYSKRGKDLYNQWYQKFQEVEELEDSTGTMERLHDHILKVAMLVSLSRKTDLVLEYEDVEESIRACQDTIPGMKRITLGGSGKSISAPGTAVLLRELLMNPQHEISRTMALQKHWSHFDFSELDRIAESLFAQKAITIQPKRDSDGKVEVFYVLNPKVLERYREKNSEE